MKMSKDELKKYISELEIDNEISIKLLEDIEDSFLEGEVDSEAINELQEKLEESENKLKELQEKYKSRFLSSEIKEEKEDSEELEEVEEIDVKEI